MEKVKVKSLQLFRVGDKNTLMDMQLKRVSNEGRGVYKVMFQIVKYSYQGERKTVDGTASFYFDIHNIALLSDDIVNFRFREWQNGIFKMFRGKSGSARALTIKYLQDKGAFEFTIEEGTARNPKDNVAELDRSKPVITVNFTLPSLETRESFKSVSDFVNAFSNSTYIQDNYAHLDSNVFHRWLIAEYDIYTKS